MLRDYQQLAVNDALEWFSIANNCGMKRVYTSPTGTGKSFIENELQGKLSNAYIITPKVEIIRDLLQKRGFAVTIQEAGNFGGMHGIYTPIRLRNLLAAGTIPQPKYLIIDEVHHAEAETYKIIEALTGDVPAVGFTATGFRGTPKSTAAFHVAWGKPVEIISFGEAAKAGYLSIPQCTIEPLIDDDKVEIVNGEFNVTQIGEELEGYIGQIVAMMKGFSPRPTMFAMPTVHSARELTGALNRAGFPANCVTGDTPPENRDVSFRECVECKAALVQVSVVSEGIDLPIRRLIDLRPTLSPVFWMQMFGRITRFTDDPPEYICCCRNLLRHIYLLNGAIPAEAIASAESAFGGPGKRSGLRIVGFEGLGKFKATELPLSNGTTGLMYCLSTIEGSRVTQYTIMATPQHSTPIIASRTNEKGGDGHMRYVRWKQIEALPDVTGFASIPAKPLSPKQLAWWKGEDRAGAQTRGLDPEAKINSRQFQALPVLFDIKRRLV